MQKSQHRLTLDVEFDKETTNLEVLSFGVPQSLLDLTEIKHIGALLCTVGVDCCENKVNLHEDN